MNANANTTTPQVPHRHMKPWANIVAFALTCAFVATEAGAATPMVTFRSAIDIEGADVRLGDVADLHTLPAEWRQQAANLVIARMREPAGRADIPAARLAAAARRQLPAITPWLTPGETQFVSITSKIQATKEKVSPVRRVAPAHLTCLQLTRDISRGEALKADGVQPAGCPDAPLLAAIHYDLGAGVARASRDMTRGDVIAGIARTRLADIQQGERVTSVVRTGAVSVTRTGIALTDSGPGRPLLVTSVADSGGETVTFPTTSVRTR